MTPIGSTETATASAASRTCRRGTPISGCSTRTLIPGTMNGGVVPVAFARRDAVLVLISVVLAVLLAVPAAVWWTSSSSNASLPMAAADETESIAPANESGSGRNAGIWDPALFAPPRNLEETIQQTEDALVEVWCGDESAGTGWVIDTDREPIVRAGQEPEGGELFGALVLTAWHVVEDCTPGKEEMVVYRGQRDIPAVLLNWQKKHDVALLSVDLADPGLRVDVEAPPGTWVMTSGYPLSENPTPVFGHVIAKDEPEFYTQMPIRPGHSGSPLVNSLGRAIGVVTSVPLDEESEQPYGWTISTSVVALCERLFECPAGDIEGLGN